MVAGNGFRFLMICMCSYGGSCVREGMVTLVCLRKGGLGVEEMALISLVGFAIESCC